MEKRGRLSGKTLGGKYQLGELLGNGGVGAVYRGHHHLLNHSQAIKVLLEHYSQEAKFLERFLREARTVAALDHPHIVHIDDFGIDEKEKEAYLVMPFIGGGTFSEILKEQQEPLPVEQVVLYLEQICSALDYAHQQGVVHLDLKPQNLLIRKDGILLLSDFGLAHSLNQEVIEGGTSLTFGTPHYMAPEHSNGKPNKSSDVYALGVMFFEMLVGQRPFTGATPDAIRIQHCTKSPPLLRSLRPELPIELEEVLQRALAKQTERRFQSASALLTAFKGALARVQEQVLKAEEERRRKAEEVQARKAEEERLRRLEEEQALRAEIDQLQKAEEERARKAEEERLRRAKEKQALRDEIERLQRAEEERARKAEEERQRRVEQEQALRAQIERLQQAEEVQARRAEEERLHRAEQEQALRAQIERLQQAEEVQARRAEEERLHRAEQEQALKAQTERLQQAEEVRARQIEEERLQRAKEKQALRTEIKRLHRAEEVQARRAEEERLRRAEQEQALKAQIERLQQAEEEQTRKVRSERWNTHTSTRTGQLVPRTLLHKRYIILKVIGRGDMGTVYQAKDMKRQGALCAIKEMISSMVPPGEQALAIKNFKIEAKMLAVLAHPYLPAFTHFFAENQRYFLVMEYINGATLEELLERNRGPFSEQRVLSWAKQLCEVLEYLHSQNPLIIFRDMKPGNVMLNRQGHIKLIDFGIARFFRPTHETDGTPGYAPREQYGTMQTDERSDIYALGMTLHHLLTNKFSETGFGVKAREIRALNPQVPVALARVLEKATAFEPADRYQSVEAFRYALFGTRAFVFENGGTASEPVMLAELCTRYPEEAFEYLETGEIADWLRDIGEKDLSAIAWHIRTTRSDPLQAVEQFLYAVLGPNVSVPSSPSHRGQNGNGQQTDDEDDNEKSILATKPQQAVQAVRMPISIVSLNQNALIKYGTPNETIDGWGASMMSEKRQRRSRHILTFPSACMVSALWYIVLTQIAHLNVLSPHSGFVLLLTGMPLVSTLGVMLVERPHRETLNRLVTGLSGTLLVLGPANALLQVATGTLGTSIGAMGLLLLLVITALGATYSAHPAVSKRIWSRLLQVSTEEKLIHWAVMLMAAIDGAALGYLLTVGVALGWFTMFGILVGIGVAIAFIGRLDKLLKLYRRP